MHLSGFSIFLADAAPAASTAQTGAQNSPASPAQTLFGSPIVFIGLIVLMMYFVLIRPQNLQRKKQAQLLEMLKPGDKIVTHSGIHGVVITVKDKTVSIRSHESKMEVAKSSVVEILERSGEEKSAS